MKKISKIICFGILSWLIPFLLSFPFYSPDQGLLIDVFLFKTIMIVLGAATGAVLIILYFKKIKKEFWQEGITISASWLLINWILDLLILIPMSGQNIGQYFQEIGLRYLVLPIFVMTVACLLHQKNEQK